MQALTQVGLAISFLGVVLLGVESTLSFRYSNQYDGISTVQRKRLRWLSMPGWALVAVGFVFQSVALWV